MVRIDAESRNPQQPVNPVLNVLTACPVPRYDQHGTAAFTLAYYLLLCCCIGIGLY